MLIVTLTDNTPDKLRHFKAEHGLSLYVETSYTRILLDTGRSNAFLKNSWKIGVDVNCVHYCVITHGHNDHTGGLRTLLEETDVKVLISDKVLKEQYYSRRQGRKRDLSTEAELFEKYANRFEEVKESKWISEDTAIVYCNKKESPTPIGNKYLTKEVDGVEMPDDFDHEMALAVKIRNVLIVFSACSHCGAINIIKACKEFTGIQNVRYFIGGLHFIDSKKTTEEVDSFVSEMKESFPNTGIVTGHCTCDKAKMRLKELGLKEIKFLHAGKFFIIE